MTKCSLKEAELWLFSRSSLEIPEIRPPICTFKGSDFLRVLNADSLSQQNETCAGLGKFFSNAAQNISASHSGQNNFPKKVAQSSDIVCTAEEKKNFAQSL